MKKMLLLSIFILGSLFACSSSESNLDIRWTLINEALGDYTYYVYLDDYNEETVNIPKYYDDKKHGKGLVETIHYVGPSLKRLEVKYAKFLILADQIDEKNGQNLESIFLGKDVEVIIGLYFLLNLQEIEVDSNNERYESCDGVLYTKGKKVLYAYPIGKKETTFRVADDVIAIDNYAFANSRLETIYLGKSVTAIYDSAFKKSNIKNIYIPRSVTEIGRIVHSSLDGKFNLFYEGTEDEFNQIKFANNKNNFNISYNVTW